MFLYYCCWHEASTLLVLHLCDNLTTESELYWCTVIAVTKAHPAACLAAWQGTGDCIMLVCWCCSYEAATQLVLPFSDSFTLETALCRCIALASLKLVLHLVTTWHWGLHYFGVLLLQVWSYDPACLAFQWHHGTQDWIILVYCCWGYEAMTQLVLHHSNTLALKAALYWCIDVAGMKLFPNQSCISATSWYWRPNRTFVQYYCCRYEAMTHQLFHFCDNLARNWRLHYIDALLLQV